MTVTDILYSGSKVITGAASYLLSKAGLKSAASTNYNKSLNMSNVMPPLWKLAGRNYYFLRVAGLSGASAVILGAIGSHHLNVQEKPELRNIFETANRFHFFHSIALLGIPLTKYPLMTGSLMVLGTLLFTGCLYYRAFTGNKPPFRHMAPLGGTCLIVAWLSLLL